MEKKRIKTLLILIFGFLSTQTIAQHSIGGGVSSFHGLNLPIDRIGINVFAEIPRSPNNTFFIRGAYMFPHKNQRIDQVSAKPGITPSIADAKLITKTSYFAVDGGSRLYFFNEYDIGLGFFAGGHLKGILSSYGSKYRMDSGLDIDDYQTSTYPPQDLNSSDAQYSLLFAFGGTIGAKYQLPMGGALMFDIGLDVISRLYDPALILGNEISPISFSFNLGYRFDFY
ncbi:hypothetical protein CW751_08525 [Brumimicrobium salinarum]|uniref:Outer membrane protein beta-barrel domain-containing protein n=1 Tax=Brumimicrobium salinarum TaxID=2058658 RepID=A0A2I0R2I8_9FLAO|nr:hypothetical protein [Brumimicrobium salinarum]PKR80803.1 hypothetical protein CW751_08525 [Brumimicrobium salinarum]